jgi:hypothetical protein
MGVFGMWVSGIDLTTLGVVTAAVFICVAVLYLMWWSFEPYFLGLVAIALAGMIMGWDKAERRRRLARFHAFDDKMLDWSQIGRRRKNREDRLDD